MLFVRNNLLYEAIPQELKVDVQAVIKKTIRPKDGRTNNWFTVYYQDEQLQIPERIYTKMPSAKQIEALTDQQQVIFACLFSRHHDGFVREHYVQQLIAKSGKYPWVISYIFRLTGEYVVEILHTINGKLHELDQQVMIPFVRENHRFIQTTKSQIISYWNCNYRDEFPKFNDYIGAEIVSFLEAIERKSDIC